MAPESFGRRHRAEAGSSRVRLGCALALVALAFGVTYAVQDYIRSFDSGLAPGPRIRVENATTVPLRVGEV